MKNNATVHNDKAGKNKSILSSNNIPFEIESESTLVVKVPTEKSLYFTAEAVVSEIKK